MNRINSALAAVCMACAMIDCNMQSSSDILSGEFLTAGQNAIGLISPSDDATTTANPVLVWTAKSGINKYTIEISTKSDFSHLILSKEVSGSSYSLVNSDLAGISELDTAQYYWRVSVVRLQRNLMSKIGTLNVSPKNVVYVDSNVISTYQFGNKSTPFKKIQQAIDLADTQRNGDPSVKKTVFVAKGNYAEIVTLKPGISLYGGYESTGWSRSISQNVTTISAPFDTAIIGRTDITSAYRDTTVVDGFTINAGTITFQATYGVRLLGASTTLTNNTIDGGAGNLSYGVYNDGASSVVITNNTISGGAATGSGAFAHGIYTTSTLSGLIKNNVINGGNPAGVTSQAFGISVRAPVIILANTITGRISAAVGSSFGINITTGAAATVISNVIDSGPASINAYGISYNGGSATITNNTIKGLSSIVTSVAGLVVTNNILFATGGSYGLWESNATASPASFQNNLLFDGTALYRDQNTFDRLTEGLLILEANTTQGAAGSSSGNLGPPTIANFAAVNFISATDWHLTAATPAAVRTGGKDTSQNTCGAAGTSSCGDVTQDRDGKPRTAPYSIGAYEQD